MSFYPDDVRIDARRSAQQQRVIRSITIGLQPYLPFTQKYKLQATQGGEPGYFNVAPPAGGSDGPWQMRTSFYQSWGRKQQQINSWENAQKTSKQMGINPTKTLARYFKDIISGDMSVSARDMGKMSQSDVNEILDQMVGRVIAEPKSTQLGDDIRNMKNLSSQNFDVVFNSQSDPGSTGMFKAMEAQFGQKFMKGAVALETTVAKAGNQSSKLFARVNKADIKAAGSLRNAFKSKIEQELAKMNSSIAKYGKTTPFKKIYEDYPVGNFTREMLDRGTRMLRIGGNASYLYQVKLRDEKGNPRIGVAKLAAQRTRDAAIKFILRDVRVADVGGFGGIFDLLAKQGRQFTDMTAKEWKDKMHDLFFASADYAIATEARMGQAGEVFSSSVSLNTENMLGIYIGEASKMGNQAGLTAITPTTIAQGLSKQIEDYLKDPIMQGQLSDFFQQLLKESGKLTDVWREKAREVGKGASKLFGYKDGLSIKDKGVWTPMPYKWNDNIGQNLSISPFLTSRRAGIYAIDGKRASVL